MRHPSREDLLAYAESLVDQGAPVSSALAAHVTACKRCSAEVREIRESLDFTASAQELEPSKDLTAQILLAVQSKKRPGMHWRIPGAARAAAAIALTGFALAPGLFWFQYVLAPPDAAPAARAPAAQEDTTPVRRVTGPERRARDLNIRRLSDALTAVPEARQHPAEQRLRRIAGAAAEDAAIARDALRRNPGSLRARQALDQALEAREAALRTLYLVQTLPGWKTAPASP